MCVCAGGILLTRMTVHKLDRQGPAEVCHCVEHAPKASTVQALYRHTVLSCKQHYTTQHGLQNYYLKLETGCNISPKLPIIRSTLK